MMTASGNIEIKQYLSATGYHGTNKIHKIRKCGV